MNKNQEPLIIYCADHKRSPYQFVSLERGTCSKRLLCAECLFPEDQGNTTKDFFDHIPLSLVSVKIIKALNDPEAFFEWVKKDQYFTYLQGILQFSERDLEKEFNDQISKFDLLSNILNQIKEQLKKKLSEYKNLQATLKKYRDQFCDKINYNKFCGLMKQMNDQVIVQISSIIDEILKNDCSLMQAYLVPIFDNHVNIVTNLPKPTNDQFKEQINQLFKQNEEFIENLNKDVRPRNEIFQFKVLSNDFYVKMLHKKIQNDQKQIDGLNLIYLGSRDGLNGNVFQSKVHGKKQLLMIFKSKNNGNYIFGGYSPCQWQYNVNYVQDDTLTSFLFSQTHNQIYPLKQDQKGQAIRCYQGYGPVFGGGYDICIMNDFNQGYSKLGETYQWDQYQGQNSEHLFGGAQPNISECEIYEILFA